MRVFLRKRLDWPLVVAPAAVFLLSLAFCPAAALAQDTCQSLSGDARRQCLHDEVAARTAANRAAADAARRARQGAAAPSDAPTQGNIGSGQAILLSGPGRPVVTRDGKRANLTVISHSSYNGRESRYTIPVTRSCIGQSTSDSSLTFDKACHSYSLKNFQAAQPLFKQACDEGDPSGCFMFASGMGSGPANRPTVLALFRTACNDGQRDACYELAEAYRVGNGVPMDAVQVRAYYEQGCGLGQAYSCAWLEGKINPNCPHGVKVYVADLNKKTYKVLCRTTGANFMNPEEHEIPASAVEIDEMKKYAEMTKNAPTISMTEFVRRALASTETSGSGQGPHSCADPGGGACQGQHLIVGGKVDSDGHPVY